MSLPDDSSIRVGVVGLGRRGLHYLERWRDGSAVRVVAACDPDPAVRSAATVLCDRISAESEPLLADPAIDVVLLAVPTAVRACLGCRILVAGKHLAFADPPVAASVAEIRGLVDAANDAERQVVVWSPWRDEPDFRAALAAVRSGQTEDLRLLRYERWQPALLAAEPSAGDELPRSLVYVLDQLVALAASPAERVYVGGRTDRALTVVVHFRDGGIANVVLHRDATVRLDHGWALDGERGGFAAGRRWVRSADGEIYDVLAETPAAPTIEAVLRSALAGGPPLVTMTESLRLAALLAAVAESLRTRQVAEVEPVP